MDVHLALSSISPIHHLQPYIISKLDQPYLISRSDSTMWSKPKSSKSHHQSNTKSSKSSSKMGQATKASPKQAKPTLSDMTPFWEGIKRGNLLCNPRSTIIAVVGRDEVKELKKLVEDKKEQKKENIGM